MVFQISEKHPSGSISSYFQKKKNKIKTKTEAALPLPFLQSAEKVFLPQKAEKYIFYVAISCGRRGTVTAVDEE